MSPSEINAALLWALRAAYPILALVAIWKRRWTLPLWTLYLVAISVSAWLYRVPWTVERVLVPDLGCVLPLRAFATLELIWKLTEWEPERHAWSLRKLLGIICLLGIALPLLWRFYEPSDIWHTYKLIRICLHVGLAFGFGMGVLYLWINGQKSARYVRQYSAIWMLHLSCYAVTGLSTSREWWDAVEVAFGLGSLLCIGLWLQRSFNPLDPHF